MRGRFVQRAGYAPARCGRWYQPITLFGRREGDSDGVAVSLARLCTLLPAGKSLRLVAANDAVADRTGIPAPFAHRAHHLACVRLFVGGYDAGAAWESFAAEIGLEECAPPPPLPLPTEGAGCLRFPDGTSATALPLLRVPDVTRTGWLDAAVHLPFPCRVVVSVTGLSAVSEEARLRHGSRKISAAQGAVVAGGGITDHLQHDAAQEYRAVLTRVQDPATRVHLLGVCLIVFASDRAQLAERRRIAADTLRTAGAVVASGLCDQRPLYLASTPEGEGALPRRHLFRALSPTVGTSWPGISHAAGHRSGDPIGTSVPGGELVRYDPFAETLANSLINIVGSTGSGKTFWALQMAARTLRSGGRVTILAAAGPYLSLGALGSLCHVVPRPHEPLVVPDPGAAVLFCDLSQVAGDELRALVPAIFRMVWQRATQTDVRDFVVVDEGWNLVLYGGAAEYVERIFRLGRQAGIFSAFLTQKLTDLLRDPAAAAVYEQAATSFYFRQSDANLSALRDLEDLSAAEMAALPHLPRILGQSADAFLVTKEAEQVRRGVVRLWSTPAERLLFGSYPAEARARAAAIAQHGSLAQAVGAL